MVPETMRRMPSGVRLSWSLTLCGPSAATTVTVVGDATTTTVAGGAAVTTTVAAGGATTDNIIGFSVERPAGVSGVNVTYDLRIQEMSKDEPRVVANVPLQVTSVQYSSDERIKQDIVDVDVDDSRGDDLAG